MCLVLQTLKTKNSPRTLVTASIFVLQISGGVRGDTVGGFKGIFGICHHLVVFGVLGRGVVVGRVSAVVNPTWRTE